MSQMFESFMAASVATPSVRGIALDQLPASAESGRPLQPAANPLLGLKVRLDVCVGHAHLTVGELLAARESEVLVLDQPVEHPVDLLLDGRVIARGHLVAVDQAFAVRITELPLKLGL